MKHFGKFILSFIIAACVMSCQKDKEIENYNLDVELLLSLMNKHRAAGCKCGDTDMPPAPALKWNKLLAKAAYNHSVDMATQKYFSHTSLDGRSASDRIIAVGYPYTTFGENIAKGYSNEESVIKGWMQSPGHCVNIMNKSYSEVGAGREGNYWTLTLAHPAPKTGK